MRNPNPIATLAQANQYRRASDWMKLVTQHLANGIDEMRGQAECEQFETMLEMAQGVLWLLNEKAARLTERSEAEDAKASAA